MKTQPALLFLAIFVITSLACSLGLPQVSRIKTGATQTFTLNEPRPGKDAVQNVNLKMGMGEHKAGHVCRRGTDGACGHDRHVFEALRLEGIILILVAEGHVCFERSRRRLPGRAVCHTQIVRR